jgi:hypothetical protein
MNNPLVRVVLIGLLLMMLIAPFAGLAPLMLVVFGFGVFWSLGLLVKAFLTGGVEQEHNKATFESSKGKS